LKKEELIPARVCGHDIDYFAHEKLVIFAAISNRSLGERFRGRGKGRLCT